MKRLLTIAITIPLIIIIISCENNTEVAEDGKSLEAEVGETIKTNFKDIEEQSKLMSQSDAAKSLEILESQTVEKQKDTITKQDTTVTPPPKEEIKSPPKKKTKKIIKRKRKTKKKAAKPQQTKPKEPKPKQTEVSKPKPKEPKPPLKIKILGYFDRSYHIKKKQVVRILFKEPIKTKEIEIPKNNYIFGYASIIADRLYIEFTHITYKGEKYRFKGYAYDYTDLYLGISTIENGGYTGGQSSAIEQTANFIYSKLKEGNSLYSVADLYVKDNPQNTSINITIPRNQKIVIKNYLEN